MFGVLSQWSQMGSCWGVDLKKIPVSLPLHRKFNFYPGSAQPSMALEPVADPKNLNGGKKTKAKGKGITLSPYSAISGNYI